MTGPGGGDPPAAWGDGRAARERALVTGGLGFLGRHLCRRLAAEGVRVRVLDVADPPAPGGAGLADDVELRPGSVLDREAVRRALEGAETVFHLAAISDLWRPDPDDYLRVNRDGTRVVLDEIARAGIGRFLHVSSETVRQLPVGWDGGDPGPEAMAGPYSASKLLAEREAWRAASAGLHVVVARPAVPIGPGDPTPTPPTRMLEGFLNGRHPAYLDAELDLVDVRDVAAACVLAARRGTSGRAYPLGHRRLRIRELLALLEELTGLPMPRWRIPYPAALAAAAVQEAAGRLLPGRRPSASREAVRLARRPTVEEAEPAWEELGHRPRPLRETLADTIRWLEEEGRLRRPLRTGR